MTPDTLTPKQLQILQHALGRDQYGRSNSPGNDRNHFCAGEDDEPTCKTLVAMGYMIEHRRTKVFPYYNCSVTQHGRAAMLAASPPAPRRSKSQLRYEAFLDWKDATGGNFRAFLKTEHAR